jgi:hypothetical protein
LFHGGGSRLLGDRLSRSRPSQSPGGRRCAIGLAETRCPLAGTGAYQEERGRPGPGA